MALTPNPPKVERRIPQRIFEFLYEERWLIAIFLAALAVRLHWNLEVHPLGDYIYSDMNGYDSRANKLLRNPTKPSEYAAFFPWGTHVLVAGMKAVFGKENFTAIGILWATVGALGVAFTYAITRRASRFALLAPLVGCFAVIYYPHISMGGYMLSEVLFSTALMGALLFVQRMADHGRKRDAVMMGLCAGIGAMFRPQLLLSAAVVGLFWIVRRKSLERIKLTHLLVSAIPLAIILGISAGHMYFNTGRLGLVSENGSFNLVFGRCHNSKIESLPDGKGHGKVHFRPPPFLQAKNHEAKALRERVKPEVALNPAIGDEFAYKGYIGDRKQHMDYIRKCLAITGWKGQAEYTWTNVRLLWLYNIPWPDSGRHHWRNPTTWWSHQHNVWLAIPALIGLIWILVPGRRAARLGLVSVNLLAVLLLAAIYFGGTRHRSPYDLVIIILAFETYATAGWLLLRGVWWAVQRSRAAQVGGGGAGGGGSGDLGVDDDADADADGNLGGKSAQKSSSS